MKTDILIRRTILFFAVLIIPAAGILHADGFRKNEEKPPFFTWDLLLTGSWSNNFKNADDEPFRTKDIFSGGTLFNRGDLNLAFPRASLSFRFLAMDKRDIPPDAENPKAGFVPGAGVYHRKTGSRILWGEQNEYGLPARIRNMWLRAVPFAESRSPSARDLKTEPSSKSETETSLYLALPIKSLFGAFASAALDEEINPALGGGFGFYGKRTELRFEGFFTQEKLPPRKARSWFSETPPLPERDFRIHALGFIFNSEAAAVASDWAWSQTFAWGRGVYGNAALRLGNKPWRFSLAGDGAAGRFADRDGTDKGTGFRIAAKGEHFRPRSGLLRLQGTFRAPSAGEIFDRGALSFYFRPQTPKAGKAATFPFRFTRVSFDLSRDAKTPEKITDTLDAALGFRLFFLTGAVSYTLHNLSAAGEETSPFFRPPFFETFESFKVSGELGWKPGIFNFGTRVGYTARAEKDSIWDVSLNCSVRPGRWGRFGFKIASTDFPEKWNYSLTWRFDSRFW